ncbi:MAG: amidase, partial [Deltaproteobacteria bacterium]|nr:amidase [Deltaproteobacteria bacterium]
MSNLEELFVLDATAQADLIRRKEITPIELVDAVIERIERLNPTLNAVVTPMYDLARKAAKGKLPDGPFTGVPFLLKDLILEVKGVRLTEGYAFLKNHISDIDSELAIRFRNAGLIFTGKTNTCEFGLLTTTEPKLFGPCRNPWDTAKTTGGSSGGSAAAVAAGMVPMAHGNDGGGSIRIPASCCGLFGLKPSRGRNPLGPEYSDIWMSYFSYEHALTRSVRDSAALLDATAGPEIGSPYWVPPPKKRPFITAAGADPGKLKIGFSLKTVSNEPLHPAREAAVKDAAKLCADLGHEVDEICPDVDEGVVKCFGRLWSVVTKWSIDYWANRTGNEATPDQFEDLTWKCYQIGAKRDAVGYINNLMALQKCVKRVMRFFEKYDIWLTSTLYQPPLELGSFEPTPENRYHAFDQLNSFSPLPGICNATGQPAMSVPLFWNADGLPVGTHFAGRYDDEETLFSLAAQLEKARPWAG